MLEVKEKIMVVSSLDFYKEIESSDDIIISNLKNDIFNKASECAVVMFTENGMTHILKNRYGSTGSVV